MAPGQQARYFWLLAPRPAFIARLPAHPVTYVCVTAFWGLGLLALPALVAWQHQTPTLPNAAIVQAKPVIAPGCASAQGLLGYFLGGHSVLAVVGEWLAIPITGKSSTNR